MSEYTNDSVENHDDFAMALVPYIQRGAQCVLWGKSVHHMCQKELIGFIGFLDELNSKKAPLA